jgi:hypothetical protein
LKLRQGLSVSGLRGVLFFQQLEVLRSIIILSNGHLLLFRRSLRESVQASFTGRRASGEIVWGEPERMQQATSNINT